MAPSTSYDDVNDHYSRIARERTKENEKHSEKVALSFGYSLEELSDIPEGSNLGVSCGNPIALAGLKEVNISVGHDDRLMGSLLIIHRARLLWTLALVLVLTYSWQPAKSAIQVWPSELT